MKYFGNSTLIPSMNKIIEKRDGDDIMEFGEKVLAFNSGISLSTFKEIIYRFISIKKYSLYITEEYLKNFFYNWKSKNRINSFYYAYDHTFTYDNKIFLQILNEKYVSDFNFNNNKPKLFRLIYIIWGPPFHLNRMRYSSHFYLYFTFIRPYPMIQTLVILYIDLYTGIKAPDIFVTLNTKNQFSYEIIFKEIRDILTNNNTFPIVLQTYTIP